MYTPYDWQEGIGNRAQYIEGKLAQGAPVLAVSLEAGLVFFTFRRQGRKIYEIYDRLIFGGLGLQSDVEALRMAALEFASREGFSRSEEDVSIQRLAVALSAPFKGSFADFSKSPIVARVLLAEIGESIDEDTFYRIEYDGDYFTARRALAIAGSAETADKITKKLEDLDPHLTPQDAILELEKIWKSALGEDGAEVDSDAIEGMKPEAVLLRRPTDRENRFEALTPHD